MSAFSTVYFSEGLMQAYFSKVFFLKDLSCFGQTEMFKSNMLFFPWEENLVLSMWLNQKVKNYFPLCFSVLPWFSVSVRGHADLPGLAELGEHEGPCGDTGTQHHYQTYQGGYKAPWLRQHKYLKLIYPYLNSVECWFEVHIQGKKFWKNFL